MDAMRGWMCLITVTPVDRAQQILLGMNDLLLQEKPTLGYSQLWEYPTSGKQPPACALELHTPALLGDSGAVAAPRQTDRQTAVHTSAPG